MHLQFFSYRYAKEILQHPNNVQAWKEIEDILANAPVFVFPGKSKQNKKAEIVQQLLNTYFDRRFAVDHHWDYHPLATGIKDSSLAADFRKKFPNISIQAEVQFGNMARWYSDIFKFQTAYAQSLIHCGLCVVPMSDMASRIDSNIVNFERVVRELPSANLSITLPILVVGLLDDKTTERLDVRQTAFSGIKDFVGKGNAENRWRVVHGFLSGVEMASLGPTSETGPMLDIPPGEDE